MKYGIICTMTNGFGRKGYYNSQELGLARAICRQGHQVVIYKGLSDGETPDHTVTPEGIEIYYLAMKHLRAHGWLDCGILDPEIAGVLVFGDQQFFLRHIWKYCQKRKIAFVPYVGTTRSEFHATFYGRVTDCIFHITTLPIYKQLPVIAKTEAARKELEALGVRDIRVAPVGIDASVLNKDFRNADRAKLREQYGFAPDDVVICNVSRMDAVKRPLELLDVFCKVRGKKKFKLLIIGRGELREQVAEKIKRLGLEEDVRMIESIPNSEMWKIYTMSDYYLNMNREEIFGMAIMEAVYYCCSVVAANALGPSITLAGMEGHCLCDSDEEMVQRLLAPYPDRNVLEESSSRLLSKFTWDRCAEAFLKIAGCADTAIVKAAK